MTYRFATPGSASGRTRPAGRSLAVLSTAAVAAVAALTTGPAAVAATPTPRTGATVTDVTADCIGDVLRGEIQAYGRRGDVVTVTASSSVSGTAPFVAGPSKTVTLLAHRHAYPYSFDVAALANSYRLRVTAVGRTRHSVTIRTDTCAPGTDVPESAAAVALPAGLLLTAGGAVLLHRRRSRRTDDAATTTADA